MKLLILCLATICFLAAAGGMKDPSSVVPKDGAGLEQPLNGAGGLTVLGAMVLVFAVGGGARNAQRAATGRPTNSAFWLFLALIIGLFVVGAALYGSDAMIRSLVW